MKFEPEIQKTAPLTDDFVNQYLDELGSFDFKKAGISGDKIIGLCHNYFPVVGVYRFSHSQDSRAEVTRLIEAFKQVKTPKPHCIVVRGTQLDVFAFDENIFAYVMLKLK